MNNNSHVKEGKYIVLRRNKANRRKRQTFHTVEVDGDGEPLRDSRTRTSLWGVPEYD